MNTTSCPGCNAPVPAASNFCGVCGARLPEPFLAAAIKPSSCLVCQASLEDGGRFCGGCGAPVPGYQQEPAVSVSIQERKTAAELVSSPEPAKVERVPMPWQTGVLLITYLYVCLIFWGNMLNERLVLSISFGSIAVHNIYFLTSGVLGTASLLLMILIWRGVRFSRFLGMITSGIGILYLVIFQFFFRSPYIITRHDTITDLVDVFPLLTLLSISIVIWNLASTKQIFR